MTSILANCQRSFVENAIHEERRTDNRQLDEFRAIKIHFGNIYGLCHVTLGHTRVIAQVSCEVQEPSAVRPNEGILRVNFDVGPMAGPQFEAGRPTNASVQVSRLLEKCLKDSKVVDLEVLCISAEKKVWSLRLDVNVMNTDGNVIDCASIAALAALAHFKRPDITMTGEQCVVHDIDEREPIPLILQHYPIYCTYALFDDEKLVADPTELEERVAKSQISIAVNSYNEICGLHMSGSTLTGPQVLLSAASKAARHAAAVVKQIKQLVQEDFERRDRNMRVGLTEWLETNQLMCFSKDVKFNWEDKKCKVKEVTDKAREIVVEDNAEVVVFDENTAELIDKKSISAWLNEPSTKYKKKSKSKKARKKEIDAHASDGSEEDEVMIID